LSSSLVNVVLFEYALFLGILMALHPDIFDQPGENWFSTVGQIKAKSERQMD